MMKRAEAMSFFTNTKYMQMPTGLNTEAGSQHQQQQTNTSLAKKSNEVVFSIDDSFRSVRMQQVPWNFGHRFEEMPVLINQSNYLAQTRHSCLYFTPFILTSRMHLRLVFSVGSILSLQSQQNRMAGWLVGQNAFHRRQSSNTHNQTMIIENQKKF